eukprot:6172785-Prymnesium_polylepis.2
MDQRSQNERGPCALQGARTARERAGPCARPTRTDRREGPPQIPCTAVRVDSVCCVRSVACGVWDSSLVKMPCAESWSFRESGYTLAREWYTLAPSRCLSMYGSLTSTIAFLGHVCPSIK